MGGDIGRIFRTSLRVVDNRPGTRPGYTDDIIDKQRFDGPALANILPSDGGFVSEGCQPWTLRR